ncbi:MAG: phytoene/squalene synthase family protein [Bryobacteraceae bacterium]|nr:phytoene/squalene synthase family protein [Bryobacteraceae bacterium]
MTSDLAKSYAYCDRVARRHAKNFYYSFRLLSAEQRSAMCAIYAFMRHCDDLSDEPELAGRPNAAEALDAWRQAMVSALDTGASDGHPVWPAFCDSVRRYRIPHTYFHEMIDGVTSDLYPRSVATFNDLYRYCYQVASVVGLTVIHIFGYEDSRAIDLAEKCGIAFQLTNIVRDVREDAEKGRVYLPAEDLERFGVASSDLRGSHLSPRLRALLEFEVNRARGYYRESQAIVDMVQPRSRPALWALIEIYSRLLDRIESSGYDVLRRRIGLSAVEKSWILIRAMSLRAYGSPGLSG